MAKETALRRIVYAGIGLVIAGAVFSAFVAIPRMAMHPEVIEDGAVISSWFFVIIQLIVAAVLMAFIIPNWDDIWRIKGVLIFAGVVVIILGLMISAQAHHYLTFHGFYDVAILRFICAGANLIAGILLIIALVKIKRSTSSE
jgi:hypothetical protein